MTELTTLHASLGAMTATDLAVEEVASLQWAAAAAFTVLGLIAVGEWLRRRERGRGYLALALGLFGLIILLGQVQKLLGDSYPRGLTYFTTAAFMGCGYALLLF